MRFFNLGVLVVLLIPCLLIGLFIAHPWLGIAVAALVVLVIVQRWDTRRRRTKRAAKGDTPKTDTPEYHITYAPRPAPVPIRGSGGATFSGRPLSLRGQEGTQDGSEDSR